jgi:aryl-alcohol dehydrogenase-like predicted oxidoreductase
MSDTSSLGNSGLKISKIIMGCMVFGSSKWQNTPWTLDEEDGLKLLKKAYDCGINTWVGGNDPRRRPNRG